MTRPTFTQETVLAVIRSRGVFQINPLRYGSQRNIPLLKKMVADGLLVRQRVTAGLHNYFLPSKTQPTET